MNAPLYLNIGCGQAKLPGFVNVDIDQSADVVCDVRLGLPFDDATVDAVYSEHFIEHLSQPEIIRFLRECRRVLRPEGRIRIATPDLDQLADHYVAAAWKDQAWLSQYGYDWVQTKAEYLNLAMREWGHQWLLNEEELDRLAFWSGLDSADRCALNVSSIPILCNLETRIESSLIKEYLKPKRSLGTSPLVSIIIPAYRSDFLSECIHSARNQTYSNLEILVLDDRAGSLWPVVEPHCLSDARVHYHANSANIGEPDNLTRAIALARGELIKPLYDDDLLEPQAVERLLLALQASPQATLAVARRLLVDVNGVEIDQSPLGTPLMDVSGTLPGDMVIGQLLERQHNYLGEPSCMMFRRADAIKIKEPNVMSLFGRVCAGMGDVCLAMHLLARGNLAYVSDVLVHFRRHAGQTQMQKACQELAVPSWRYAQAQSKRLGFYSSLAKPYAPVLHSNAKLQADVLSNQLEHLKSYLTAQMSDFNNTISYLQSRHDAQFLALQSDFKGSRWGVTRRIKPVLLAVLRRLGLIKKNGAV